MRNKLKFTFAGIHPRFPLREASHQPPGSFVTIERISPVLKLSSSGVVAAKSNIALAVGPCGFGGGAPLIPEEKCR